MQSVLLVDDDIAVLEFLQIMVPWNACNFRLAGTCTNAYDALQQCREEMPDLILTDIGMLGMDGIELIKAIKGISQRPRFVILSCHDEFRYAQQAVQIGVEDYVLKETLETQTIVDLLINIRGKIEAEEQLHHEVRKLHFQAHRSISALKEKWLKDLLSMPVSEDPSWTQQLEEFGLKLGLPNWIPVFGRLHGVRDALKRYENEDTIKFIVENAVEELLKDETDTLFFSYSAKDFCLLFNCRKELKVNPHERITKLSKEIQRKLTLVLKLPFSIIVGGVVNDRAGIKREMSNLIQDAEQLFYCPAPEFIRTNESSHFQFDEEDPFVYYYEYADKMNRFILECHPDTSEAVDPFIHFISSHKFSPKAVKQFALRLVLDIMMKLKFNQQYTNEKVQLELQQIGNIGELRDWLLQFVKQAVSLMEQISNQSKKVEIGAAQKYVRLHLDQKITLEEVAAQLHLNASYFSRLFKKETGENFIEYVTRIKMEKAKELLNGSDRTMETIAQMLGYENKGYFVKLFKQHYGVLPSRFV
jgi:two-component system, response regulator YesN